MLGIRLTSRRLVDLNNGRCGFGRSYPLDGKPSAGSSSECSQSLQRACRAEAGEVIPFCTDDRALPERELLRSLLSNGEGWLALASQQRHRRVLKDFSA